MKTLTEPKFNDLRVWWMPQISMGKRFFWPIATVAEGANLLSLLAECDMFQLENNIKPDFCNAGGIEHFVDDSENGPEWQDWYDEESGIEDPSEYLDYLNAGDPE